MTKTEQNIYELVAPTVEQLGYLLYDVEYVKEGKEYFLRIYIDNENGIDLDDCEKVSTAIDPILDEADPISTAYSLEVSSCGLERHLREERHYVMAIGKEIEVKLFKPFDSKRELKGVLENFLDGKITLETEENEVVIEISNIASAKILFKWEEWGKWIRNFLKH